MEAEGLPTSAARLRSKVQDVSSTSKPAVTKLPAGREQPIKKPLLGMQRPMPAARVTAAAAVPPAAALRDTLHIKGRDVIYLFGFSYESVNYCVFSGATVSFCTPEICTQPKLKGCFFYYLLLLKGFYG